MKKQNIRAADRYLFALFIGVLAVIGHVICLHLAGTLSDENGPQRASLLLPLIGGMVVIRHKIKL